VERQLMPEGMNRRSLIQAISTSAVAAMLPGRGLAWPASTGVYNSAPPTDNVIPISTLSTGAYAANFWTGFTTPASTIYNPANAGWACGSGGANNFFEPTGDGGGLNATSTTSWRDVEVTTWLHRGCIYLRMAGGTALVCFINGDANSCNGLIEMGIVENFVPGTGNTDFGGTGNFYFSYVNENPTSTLAGYSNSYSPGNTITFGCSGFNVYLKINGTKVVSFTEWRCAQFGVTAVFGHEFYDVAGVIKVHYLPPVSLYSTPSANIYDPRDFGMRYVAPVTGSMSASSNQLTLTSASTFQVGDQIIVEIGGESGAGQRGTIGVGGTWPALNYATVAAMLADTSQATATCCYVQASSGSPTANPFTVYSWSGLVSFTGTQSGTNITISSVTGGTILIGNLLVGTGITVGTKIVSQTSGTTGGAGVYVTSLSGTASSASCTAGWNQGLYQFPTLTYYPALALPIALVATITAISGTTLTLNGPGASVATTNANVWLDCLPSFFCINQNENAIIGGSGSANTAPNPQNMQISIPPGDWRLSNIVSVGTNQPVAAGLQVYGQASSGINATTLHSPMGICCGAINLAQLTVNNISIEHLAYAGNQGANGYMFQVNSANIPSSALFPTVFLVSSNGAASTGLVINDIQGLNALGPFLSASGNGPIISNGYLELQDRQRDYVQWEFSLNVSAGNWGGGTTPGTLGIIENCTGTCPYAWQAFEVFGCNGCSFINCGGTNCNFSTNSSTSTCISQGLPSGLGNNINFTSLNYNPAVGLDDGIWNVNTNAFGSGTTGIFIAQPGFQCIQTGYCDSNSNNYKFITVQPIQSNWTFQGGFLPGGQACGQNYGGYFKAPDYVPGSQEYGSMLILSEATGTKVNGLRIVGAGAPMGTGGLSGYGNIYLNGSGSEVENCVADVIGTGSSPTLINNQTNAAYGGC
jgi:hypothetical protein